jgi:hypothetical protein
MSSWKIKARKRELTSVDHERIANAVHRAVCEFTETDGFRSCVAYAQVGAYVANIVSHDDNRYVCQAGGVRVRLDKDDDLCIEMRPAATDYSGLELHCWITRVPRNAVNGVIVDVPPDQLEIADLSLRHFPKHAEVFGLPWRRTNWPNFFWGKCSELRALGVYPFVDERMMRMVMEDQRKDKWFPTMVRRALELL